MVNHSSFKKTLFVSSLCLISLMSNNLMAKEAPKGYMNKGYDLNGERCMKQVNLSKEQREKMKSIAYEIKIDRSDIKKEMKNTHEQLKGLFNDSVFDEEKAKGIIQAGQKKSTDAMVSNLKTKHEIYQVLTPEQKRKFERCQEKQFK